MARYVQLLVDLPEGEAEVAAATLHELGSLGLEVRDSANPPLPGVRAPATGRALLVASFEGEDAARRAQAEMASMFPGAATELADVPDTDWSTRWRALIRSVETQRLWVGPPWMRGHAPAGKTVIVIEPKMAFGTGDHPTTLLCLEAIDAFLAQHAGASVLDVGTGTGVLAIAARKLGAGRVVGVDTDATSISLALENVELNAAQDVELSGNALEQIPGRFALVVANILANTLVELAPGLASRAAKRLILAGVLHHQQAEVTAAFERQGLLRIGGEQQGEWVRLDFEAGA